MSRQSYVPTNTNVQAQISALQASGAQVVVAFTIPAFTSLALLSAAQLGYHPVWVVSNVGSDPVTLASLLKTFSKGAAGTDLATGMITDGYLPPLSDVSNPWVRLFRKIHDKYIPDVPFDNNVEYGLAEAFTLAQVLKDTGRQPTRAGLVKTLETTKLSGGPGLVPFGYSKDDHLGYLGVQMAKLGPGGTETPIGPVYTTSDTGPIKEAKPLATEPPPNGVP